MYMLIVYAVAAILNFRST